MRFRAATPIFLMLALLLPACGDGGRGRSLYREGRFEEAHEAFRAATEAPGASGELYYDRALAALRVGDLSDCEESAALAGSYSANGLNGYPAFVQGNCSFARCETAAIQADTPEAEPFAFDVAIGYGEEARDMWAFAARSRADWPEARRNLERALLKLEELARLKAEAEARRQPPPPPEPPPAPEPAPEPAPNEEKTEEDAEISAQMNELSPEKVLGLLELLAEKEREKLDGRRERLRAAAEGVERGW